MNKIARRHLLTVLDRASRPLFKATLPEGSPAFNDALADIIRSLGARTSVILPPAATIEIVKPRNMPRVVAGKGTRRRGVRGRLPRAVDAGQWGAPRPLPGTWKALAMRHIFDRDTVRRVS